MPSRGIDGLVAIRNFETELDGTGSQNEVVQRCRLGFPAEPADPPVLKTD